MSRFLCRGILQRVLLTIGIVTLARPVSAGPTMISLARLAPELGYTCVWVASESAMALTRRGLYVLIRPGNRLYDVNNAVESTVQAPQYRDNDIFVGSTLARRLRSLSLKYGPLGNRTDSAGLQTLLTAPARGALTVAVVATNIADSVLVSGMGPGRIPLVIILSADVSRSLPRLTLSRTYVETDAKGVFSVQISTAPLHLQDSTILITAASLPGIAEARTSIVLGQPNPNVAQPVDDLPRDFRPH